MHTNGRVTNQYLENCKNNQCTQTDSVKINDTLHISKDYLLVSASILQEVTFKLSITLWRKIFPNELEMSDKYANNHLFSLLIEEDYMLAANLGERITAADTLRSGLSPSLGLKAHCPPSRFLLCKKTRRR
jgi:hypothetical protein